MIPSTEEQRWVRLLALVMKQHGIEQVDVSLTELCKDDSMELTVQGDFVRMRGHFELVPKEAEDPVVAERKACAEVAHAAAKEATRVGLMHPEDSDSRDRMFARAREAEYIAAEIEERGK